ncbi:hypothetical protein [Luteolibacter sp. Populi]|uniref:hypothetical protein n=1 Tax=Luteolibacter sp. Populi TaxID=3230487 RepID=UPI003467BB0A
MRRAIAVFLLACLGMIIPLAASPVRICLLESSVAEQESCCSKCRKEHKHEPSCCVDVDELPDAPLATLPEGLPPIVAIDLPPPVFLLPPVNLVPAAALEMFEPIRGPDTPCSFRARLGVWRL